MGGKGKYLDQVGNKAKSGRKFFNPKIGESKKYLN